MCSHMARRKSSGVVPLAAGDSAPSRSAIVPAAKRRLDPGLERALVAGNRIRSLLSKTLTALHDAGVLNSGPVTEYTLRRTTKTFADTVTPYGTLIEKFDIGLPTGELVDVCNPFALLWVWCSLSDTFADMAKKAIVPGRPQRLVSV